MPNKPQTHIVHGECLQVMQALPPLSFDQVICSPPYENRRLCDIDRKRSGMDWVNWALPRLRRTITLSAGLSMWVVEGGTEDGAWSAAPVLLQAKALDDPAIVARKTIVYQRDGVPGSGGPYYLKNNWEHVLVMQRSNGRGGAAELPYANPTACGHPPVCPPGGAPSHRNTTGERAPKKASKPPALANPGNIIDCGAGGHVGSRIANEGDAPFPEELVRKLLLPFCPEGGWVLDCFGGTGTTAKVANVHNRNAVLIEANIDDVERSARRVREEAGVEPTLWGGVTEEGRAEFAAFFAKTIESGFALEAR